MLSAAAEPLQALKKRDSSQPIDHLLVLLSGLQGDCMDDQGLGCRIGTFVCLVGTTDCLSSFLIKSLT